VAGLNGACWKINGSGN